MGSAKNSTSVLGGLFRSAPDSALSQLSIVYSTVPFLPLIVGHCFTVAAGNQDVKDRFLLHYWLSCAGGFGGSILSAWLLMSADTVPIEFLSINSMALSWTVAWWAFNYLPGGARILGSFPFQFFCHAASAWGGAALVTDRVNQVVRIYPSVYLAPIIIATVAGCGGVYLDQMIRGGLGLELAQPLEVLQPTFATRIVVITSVGHYLLVHFWRVLLPAESAAIWITVWTAHQMAVDMLGQPLDFTLPLFQLLSKISNIPLVASMPQSAATKCIAQQAQQAARKAADSAEGAKPKAEEQKVEAKKTE